MKTALTALIVCCFITSISVANNFLASCNDTTIITHLLDGTITEWPAEKFMTDKPTRMAYAVDNNNEALFLAIKIADQATQKRIMQEGLNLYIDTKGKKKENRGIEFPVKMETIASIETMKLFGFSGTGPQVQSLKTEGSANVAIAWDSSFVMIIEYSVPLKMLEESIAELNNKKISIGWKLEQSEMPVTTNQTNTQGPTVVTRVVGVPAGSRPPGNPNSSNTTNVNNNPAIQSTSNKPQWFWTSHTVSF